MKRWAWRRSVDDNTARTTFGASALWPFTYGDPNCRRWLLTLALQNLAMSQLWHIVRPLIEGVSLGSMLSWSSQQEELLGFSPEEEHLEKQVCVPELARLKSACENEKQPLYTCRRFVCATCKNEIGSNSNLFFMLDSVYCSNRCRMFSVSMQRTLPGNYLNASLCETAPVRTGR